MFARTLYRNDFGHVFFSVCAFSFWIESSDFSIFLFKAMVLSSYLVLLLVTLGLYVSEGRLRVAGDRWPLSSSSSLYNSSSSFTALISFSRSSAQPELDGPGNTLPSLSSILFILQQDCSFDSQANLFNCCFFVFCLGMAASTDFIPNDVKR